MEYWWFLVLPYSLVFSVLMVFDPVLSASFSGEFYILPFIFIYAYSVVAITIKRFRDAGIKPVYIWFSLVPIAGALWLLYIVYLKSSVNERKAALLKPVSSIEKTIKAFYQHPVSSRGIYLAVAILLPFVAYMMIYFYSDFSVERVCDSRLFSFSSCEKLPEPAFFVMGDLILAYFYCLIIPIIFLFLFRWGSQLGLLLSLSLFGVVSAPFLTHISDYFIEGAGYLSSHYIELIDQLGIAFNISIIAYTAMVICGLKSFTLFISSYYAVGSVYYFVKKLMVIPEPRGYYYDMADEIVHVINHDPTLIALVNGFVISLTILFSVLLYRKQKRDEIKCFSGWGESLRKGGI
ncbi:hypothetical protein RED65_10434 [Oceanobacter sp. RED65]|uniref:Uncharacterized protein n=2 Tax=Bermanella marisrubri TaxID=207949 RepID=Q1N5Y9_9GAMM|nr:hypothetical protein RED65_10434 [Oceanobacter sp. RED65] [Bermanella marisrubri]